MPKIIMTMAEEMDPYTIGPKSTPDRQSSLRPAPLEKAAKTDNPQQVLFQRCRSTKSAS